MNNTVKLEMENGRSKHITLYWWNMGRKKLDFKGTIGNYFEEKKIKASIITHPKNKETSGYRFILYTGSNKITYDAFYDSFENAAIQVIEFYLSVLGDKATIIGSYKTIRILH